MIQQNNTNNETLKNIDLLNESSDKKFVTRKWNIVNDQSKLNYSVGSETMYSTEVLKSKLCDYTDVYIPVRGDITIEYVILLLK